MVETKCRQINSRKYGWTPELIQAIQTVLYWRGIDKFNKGGTVRKDISIQHRKSGIKHMPEHFMLPETTLQDNIKKATNHLGMVQVNKEQ